MAICGCISHDYFILQENTSKMEINSDLSKRAKKDLEFVLLAKDGDQDAFAKLLGRYWDSIFFMLLKSCTPRKLFEGLCSQDKELI